MELYAQILQNLIEIVKLNIYGFAPIILVIAAFAIPLLSMGIKRKRFFDVYAVFFAVIALLIAISIARDVFVEKKIIVYPFGGWPPPIGIAYEIDAYGAILGLLTASVMFVIVIYSIWYTDRMKGTGYVWFYTLLLGLEAGMLGCIYTGDAFNLFVMLEVLAICAYGLVAFYRSRPQAVEAAMKYGFIGAMATTLYFLALVLLYSSYGTLNMADLAFKSRAATVYGIPYTALGVVYRLSGGIFGNIILSTVVAIALTVWVFTFKAALFPNHFWLPDAHPEAPTPVSAALSGLVVNVGVYAVARFMYTIFGRLSTLDIVRVVVAGITMTVRDAILMFILILGFLSALVGAILMAVQSDIKRLLAYSTISHIGLIFAGLSLGFSSISMTVSRLGLTAALFHLINHSVGKALLFLSTGVLIAFAGSRDISRIAAIGRLAPIASATTVIGVLHLIGIPPFSGFFSKYLLYQAFMAANMPILAVLVIIVSAISVLGYVKIIMAALSRHSEVVEKFKEPLSGSFALIVLAITTIVLTIALPLGFRSILDIASTSLIDFSRYINSFLTSAYLPG